MKKYLLIFFMFMLFFYKTKAQTSGIDSLKGYNNYDGYKFGEHHFDSIPDNVKIIGCFKTLTKKEINLLKKYNHFFYIYGVREKNLKEITNLQNIVILGMEIPKNKGSINYLNNLKNLRHLGISSEKSVSIPDELFSINNLVSIGISLQSKKIKLDNLHKFSTMPNLNSLSLEIASESKNFDISQFEKLKNIKCLSIGFNSNLVLSDNFHTLDNLIFLEISGDKSSLEKNIETLVKMKNLKYMQIYIRDWDDLGIPNNLHKLGFLKELRISLLSSKYDKLKPDSNERFKFKTFLYEKQAEIREIFPNTLLSFW